MSLSALILAGGKATRMGNVDKGLVEFRGRRMIEWSIDVVQPFSKDIIISCNRSIDAYKELAQQVVSDQSSNFLGPLAGVQAAMNRADGYSLLVLPCDTPLVSHELIERLLESAKHNLNSIVVLKENHFLHPLHAVIPVSLKNNLSTYLDKGGRSAKHWYQLHDVIYLEVQEHEKVCLSNINSFEDIF